MFKKKIRSLARFISPVFNPRRAIKFLPLTITFFKDYRAYKNKSNEKFSESFPCLYDKTALTGIDPHYFYQGVWAFKKILDQKPLKHIDIGSKIDFVGYLSTIAQVCFVDIRPPKSIMLDHFSAINGSFTDLPFKDKSIESLSCLHVAEHIGLGRYGDALDPDGTKKACSELKRVLRPKGNLYFSVPIGEPAVHFNGHRIHSATQILQYFHPLALKELSAVFDDGTFHQNVSLQAFEYSEYACGLFHFTNE